MPVCRTGLAWQGGRAGGYNGEQRPEEASPTNAPDAHPLLEAIRRRSSVRRFDPRPVEPARIAAVLEAAVWAPNHHLTEPWRFAVVTGSARARLAELAGAAGADPARAARDRERLLHTPALIAVFALPGEGPLATRENLLATAAAVENLLLAAHALGLGAIWRTPGFLTHPSVQAFLAPEPGADPVGLIFLGYPAAGEADRPRRRLPWKAVTRWLGD
ncbi:MAG: nitroreductase family protein [Firmicutes bacterium]|nr:nitroreductase family protein [Bacillota bacterium]